MWCVGTVLLSLLLLEKKTSCSVPLNLKHQSHPHKPYDTLIVDTLEPGQEPRQHHRRKGKELFLVQRSLDKNTPGVFTQEEAGPNRGSSRMSCSKYLDTTVRAAGRGLETSVS